MHATQDTLPTADTGSVNGTLARGQLHRLVRCSRRFQEAAESFRDALGYAHATGNRNGHPDGFSSEAIDVQDIVGRVEVLIEEPPVSVAPPRSVVKLQIDSSVGITVVIGNLEARHLGAFDRLTTTDRQSRSCSDACEQHLTRHKISCREPSLHATQHALPAADTESVIGNLARGQLHRLVRQLGVR